MEMIEVKTAELIGPLLDWAVAQAEGISLRIYHGEVLRDYDGFPQFWRPSTDWSQGGPLIEKYAIEFEWVTDLALRAEIPSCGTAAHARTHLVAACRAIVASVLGDTVSVPRELMQ